MPNLYITLLFSSYGCLPPKHSSYLLLSRPLCQHFEPVVTHKSKNVPTSELTNAIQFVLQYHFSVTHCVCVALQSLHLPPLCVFRPYSPAKAAYVTTKRTRIGSEMPRTIETLEVGACFDGCARLRLADCGQRKWSNLLWVSADLEFSPVGVSSQMVAASIFCTNLFLFVLVFLRRLTTKEAFPSMRQEM